MKKHTKLIFSLCAVSIIAGNLVACAPVIVGGAVGAAVSYTDRRPTNIQTSDKGIQIEILSELSRDYPKSNIEAAVWNGRVLLVGAVASQEEKDYISTKYSKHKNVKALFNELSIGFNPALSTRAGDSVLTSKVKTALVATEGVNSNSIKIVSEGNKVFLLGWVTKDELVKAISVVRQTSGVAEVINLTEVVEK
jgi:osmotically-inducible protein OsmY